MSIFYNSLNTQDSCSNPWSRPRVIAWRKLSSRDVKVILCCKMARVTRIGLCLCWPRSFRSFSTGRRLLDEYKCVAVNEAESFIERCMRSVGTPDQHCRALSQVLVAGDVRGHFSHGLNRLGEHCIQDNHWEILRWISSWRALEYLIFEFRIS